MKIAISPRSFAVLLAVDQATRDGKPIPSREELRVLLGVKSLRSVQECIDRLIGMHLLSQTNGVARSLRLLRPLEEVCVQDAHVKPLRCRNCDKDKRLYARGLCRHCYTDPDVRNSCDVLTPGMFEGQHTTEPTEEELDQLIAEQMQNLPPWWREDAQCARQSWRVPVAGRRFRWNGIAMA
jgi:hypothetical protein